jgi:hypothetical protein
MTYAHRGIRSRKQRWLDEAYLILKEADEPLSGKEVYLRSRDRILHTLLPKNSRSAGQIFRMDKKKRFYKKEIGRSNQFVYGLREWGDGHGE